MQESKQHALTRYKPPRVHITYDVETEGAIVIKELPFVMGVIANLRGVQEGGKSYKERKFIYLKKDNFAEVMESLDVRLEFGFQFKNTFESISLCFKSIDDFLPPQIIEQNDLLKAAFDQKSKLSNLKTKILNNSRLFKIAANLTNNKETTIEQETKDFKFFNEEQREVTIDLLKAFLTCENFDKDPLITLQNNLLVLDQILQTSIDSILHNRDFQKLEGTWRGLSYLVKNLALSSSLKLRVLNATFDELNDDLDKAMEFDESHLFQKLYEEEFGTYGGNPYTCLIIDHSIARVQKDFMFLHRICEVVSCAHIPTALGVDPSMFEIDSFSKLHIPKDIAGLFEPVDMAKFKSFRELDDSRYISLVMPKFMSRAPYDVKNNPIKGLNYTETILKHEDFCWTNSVYSYGHRIASSFDKYKWFSSIIGPENGGMVSNLPVYTYKDSDGELLIKCPSETLITDRRERELSAQGIISLCHCKDSDYSVFFSGQSANKPQKYSKDSANDNAKLSSRFQCILNASRFSHYLKCIMRDKVGSFSDKEAVQRYLNTWISQYVALGTITDEIKASLPLSAASVAVEDVPGQVGSYKATIWLRPHFQMEDLDISLRLVAKIPGS
jgi:type VI secretion system protein ImpC